MWTASAPPAASPTPQRRKTNSTGDRPFGEVIGFRNTDPVAPIETKGCIPCFEKTTVKAPSLFAFEQSERQRTSDAIIFRNTKRALRRRCQPPIPQRQILRPQTRHVPPTRLVRGTNNRRRDKQVQLLCKRSGEQSGSKREQVTKDHNSIA